MGEGFSYFLLLSPVVSSLPFLDCNHQLAQGGWPSFHSTPTPSTICECKHPCGEVKAEPRLQSLYTSVQEFPASCFYYLILAPEPATSRLS